MANPQEMMAAARQKLTAPGASFEVRTEMIRGAPHHTFHHEIRVMADLYRDGLRHCDKPFLVNDDETLTFGEVYERAAGLAARMHEAGIRPGDRVALCMRNYPEWIVTFMACTGAGIICVPLNSWWKGEEILFALQDCGAKMLFADGERLAELAPVSNQLPAGMGLVGVRRGKDAPDGTINWDEFCGDLRGHSFTNASRPDEDILIMYTSGSTGRAKGVVSTHQAVLSTVLSFDLGIATARSVLPEAAVAALPPPCMLVTVPLFHVTGCHTIFLASIRQGRKLVLMYQWNPEKALELIERERVTAFMGVPTQSMELMNSPRFGDHDLSSLTSIRGGGAAMPAGQVNRIRQQTGKMSTHGYGLTETNAMGSNIAGDAHVQRPSSVGQPMQPLVEIKIFDDDGREKAPGEDGEIWIRSPSNFRGYWGQDDTNAALFRDGFFATGDIGRFDDEGYLYITDRAKDIVIRGGENIGCAEVESAIHEDPAVAEAAVFGVPDERLGEVPVAVISLRPGRDTSSDAIHSELKKHLAPFKIPDRILLRRDPLPRVASGKIFKKRLREEFIRSLS